MLFPVKLILMSLYWQKEFKISISIFSGNLDHLLTFKRNVKVDKQVLWTRQPTTKHSNENTTKDVVDRQMALELREHSALVDE